VKPIAFIILISLYLAACARLDVYEKTIALPSQKWYSNSRLSFSFNVKDTAANYMVYVVLRHTDGYEFNNLWLSVGFREPKGSLRFQNLEMILGSDAKGWEGNGMDDIFEVRKNISNGPIHFSRPGNYTFTLSQIMRQDPLKYILNAGIRVEKTGS